jgi:SAM-dependent methyltransferase
MAELRPDIRDHYEVDADEAPRLTRGPGLLELARTQEIIRRYLPPDGPSLRILDVGGGPGIHAAWLTTDGHQVHLLDPVPHHTTQAHQLATPPPDSPTDPTRRADSPSSPGAAPQPESRRITATLGDARRLPAADASFDAVLLLGPLYHLTSRDDRVQALAEARRVVRPGGFVFVAAISRFASLLDGLRRGFLFDPDFRRIVERDLADGQHRNPDRVPHWFTTAYFHHPDELPEEAAAAGLDAVAVLGVEGPAAWLPHPFPDWDDPTIRETLLFTALAVESEPTLLALSPHLLMVTKSPKGEHTFD